MQLRILFDFKIFVEVFGVATAVGKNKNGQNKEKLWALEWSILFPSYELSLNDVWIDLGLILVIIYSEK